MVEKKKNGKINFNSKATLILKLKHENVIHIYFVGRIIFALSLI